MAQALVGPGSFNVSGGYGLTLLARWRQVRAATVRHFCRHADAFAQRGVWVNGFADVHRVCAHLDGQSDLANHVVRVRVDHAAAQDLAVAVGLG